MLLLTPRLSFSPGANGLGRWLGSGCLLLPSSLVLSAKCSQSTDLGSAASPGSLLEGQMLGPHLRLTEQETRAEGAMGSNSRHGVSPPGDSDAQPSTISPASVGVGEPEALMLPAETPRYCPFCLGPSVKRGEPPGVLPCGIRVVHPPFVCH